MNKFDLFYKCSLPTNEPWPKGNEWELFISAYNSSDRVKSVFDIAKAKNKHWLIFPEYEYAPHEYPAGDVFYDPSREESEFFYNYLNWANCLNDVTSLCIDITGFMRPHLLHLVMLLKHLNIKKFDVLYTEPSRYAKKEETEFSGGPVTIVRPISGYEGIHSDNNENDLLLLNVGYDHELIKQVGEYKDYTNVSTLWGFPSLRADMFQESVLRASKASESVFSKDWKNHQHYALASDPFSTASILSDIYINYNQKKPITNLYLSPLATKPQALGFAIFYIYVLNCTQN